MKTLHANKDYVLHNGHVYIINENMPTNKGDYFHSAITGEVIKSKYSSNNPLKRKIIASTDKSLPVKHIERSVFMKPVDVGQIFDDNFDCYADTWQGDAESMHAGDVVPAMTKDKFVEVFSKTRHNTNMPLSLPETIQYDDNYENLEPIWK